MLVLQRKVGEKIVIPQVGVTLVVLEVRRRCVRLGIQAPATLIVRRAELPPLTGPRPAKGCAR